MAFGKLPGSGSVWQLHSPKGVVFPEPVGGVHHLAHSAQGSQSLLNTF